MKKPWQYTREEWAILGRFLPTLLLLLLCSLFAHFGMWSEMLSIRLMKWVEDKPYYPCLCSDCRPVSKYERRSELHTAVCRSGKHCIYISDNRRCVCRGPDSRQFKNAEKKYKAGGLA